MDAVKKLRHPEKAHQPNRPTPPKPDWIRVKAPVSRACEETRTLLRTLTLHTVCEEASCPNVGECWQKKHAAFMILGDVCTRGCAFCNVATGCPEGIDKNEPQKIADAAKTLNLKHVLVTSVTRDDLPDGGADQFVRVIESLRQTAPNCTIEILTPDFLRKEEALERVVAAKPDVYNHNLETVPRLYPTIRPGARYDVSLSLLRQVKKLDPSIFTKSGLMLGLGETTEEILQVMDDLREADVDFLTIGQYLQPTPKHASLERFVTPEEFDKLADLARAKGFAMVSSSPLTRSSYHADEDFEELKRRKNHATAF